MSSDVRSLLRQQRAARRIDHPHAAYSDAGKLLCTLCREQLKAEALWDAHLSSQPHQERLQHHRHQRQQQRNPGNNSIESAPSGPPPLPLDEDSNARMVHKRKLASSTDAAEDADMGDDEARRKRGRPDVISLTGLEMRMDGSSGYGKQRETLTPEPMPSVGNHNSKESTMTPSGLTTRKASVTPTQGVELQIPSRPATPAQAHREGAGSGTSSAGGYFNLQSQSRPQTGPSTPMSAAAAVASTSTTLREASSASSSSSLAAPSAVAGAGGASSSSAAAAAPVDESEWAAFEADIAAAEIPYDQDAVISAPAMTNEEAAAAKEAQDAAEAQSRAQVDVDIEYEREEAKRALEEEFEQMKGLEERVGKLKEMRAAFLTQRSQSTRHDGESEVQKSHLGAAATRGEVEMLDENLPDRGEDEGEDEEEEEEDDEWDLFRFRR
ncbi:hypothetical protein E4U56_003836 [Claviceps arundinis]|uniref:Coiled-coil domain-containing protein 16 n=1 Tax=Claviceps arundinis TaxID=1623583 RepID=A0A9P7MY56_9HYPO|nr:hypothetical protein E4U56_003836 [Claviceps arundinis]